MDPTSNAAAPDAPIGRSRGRLLVVDDEPTARHALAALLTDDGFAVDVAANGEDALAKVAASGYDVIVTDVRMPGIDGLELMRRARALDPNVSVVVMTAYVNVRDAVRAMREGAEHYVAKPVDTDELTLVLDRVMKQRALFREAGLLRERVRTEHRFENLLGTSPPMQSLVKTVLQVAPSRATVLLLGESGTGKERVAQAIHEASPRRDKPFVRLHCAALAEGLLESELFGHEKGSFTGAQARREGRFKLADGGTLFLDEISEVSPAIQLKLLRVLQEREFERVGGNETLKVDVRIVAATNRDLANMVRDGRFREDLYYRLNVVTLLLPPLRARRSDVPALAEHFLRRFAADSNKPVTAFAPEAMSRLMAYGWPGNVRELENVVERAVVMTNGPTILAEHLPVHVAPGTTTGVAADASDDASVAPPIPGARMEEIEKFAILSTLDACGGNTHRAADTLGVSVRMLQYRLREYRGGAKRPTGRPITPGSDPPDGDD